MHRTRAWRRAQRVRALARAKRRLQAKGLLPEHYRERWEVRLGRSATTPSPCSRPCCGNPRRWYSGRAGLTLQELRAEGAWLER